MKNHKSYQAGIQCWARQRNTIEMAFRWRADDVFGSSLPSSTKKERCKSWTPSDKSSWIRA